MKQQSPGKRRRIAVLLTVGWALATVVVAASAGFGELTRSILVPFFHEQLGMGWQPAHDMHNVVRKSLHVVAYGLFAALVWFTLPPHRRSFLAVLALVLVLAILDEAVQLWTWNRTARISDVLIDVASGATVLAVLAALRRRGSRGRPRTDASASDRGRTEP